MARKWLLVIAAVALFIVATMHGWASHRGLSAGLWSVEVCEAACRSVRWDNLNMGIADPDVILLGYGGFAMTIATAVLAVVAAIMAGRGSLLLWALGQLARATFVVLALFLVDMLARNLNPGIVGIVGAVSALAIWRAALAKV